MQEVKWEDLKKEAFGDIRHNWEEEKYWMAGFSPNTYALGQMDGYFLKDGKHVLRLWESHAVDPVEGWTECDVMALVKDYERDRETLGFVICIGSHSVAIKLGKSDYNNPTKREINIILDSLPNEFG